MASSPAWINEEELQKLSPSERAEFEAMLGEALVALEENPLETYNNPAFPRRHEKQVAFHAAKTRHKLFIAGNRAGKTYGGAADDLIQALPEEWVPDHLKAFKRWGFDEPFRCRIFTPDLTRTMEEIQETIRTLCPPSQLQGGSWDKAYAKAERVLKFRNGSFFDFFSYDQDLDKMGSVSRHRIHFDEEPPEEVYRQSRKRIIDTGGDLVFTFTPELGISWSYDALYERRTEDGFTVIQAGMYDNPHLSKAEIDHYVSDLTEEETRVALYGEYVAIGGLFFPEFSDEHLCDPPKREHLKGQSVVVGIDPGLRTTAAVFIAFDNDNTALIFDEVYAKNEIPEQIAQRIKDRAKFWKITPSFVIDPSARNRATVNAEAVQSAFTLAGIRTSPAQNDRQIGILEVKRRLQQKTLVISRDCQNLRQEFPRYRRRPGSSDEWEAVKVNDHGLDACRYALLTRAWYSPKKPLKPRPYTGGWTPGTAPEYRETPKPVSPMGEYF